MIRLLVILIIFISGYGVLFYLFNNAGNLSLVLGIWQLSIPIVQFLFVLITFLILLILFSYAFTKLFIYPRAAYMRYKSSNEQKGLEHLRETLVAITEGNTDKATQSQKKFKKYLTLYYVVIYPFIAFLFIFFFISGGPIFFDFSYGIIAAVISIIIGFFIPSKFKFYYFIFVPITLYIALKYFIFYEELIELGKLDGLNWVETGAWGGLSLTFIISFFCLIFCFPIGMAFALGRRSDFPLIRYISIGFIEFWRGVPLITVLFMSAVMFPMFLPADFFIDKLVRCIIAISLFEAAYVAEVIRGGLQALPRGQYEAAKSLGMGYWRMHIFVILPQALKLVIPGIANTFLALVKDTPLIFVVGLLEIVGMLNLAKTNPEWLGFAMEGYVFAAIIFWIICYAMSKYSYNLEQKYKTER